MNDGTPAQSNNLKMKLLKTLGCAAETIYKANKGI
jgi:hypothetical protein